MIEAWIANDPASGGRSDAAILTIPPAGEPLGEPTPVMAPVELLNELLRAIVGVLDARDVFPRIAQTANQLLQHDCLDLIVHDRFGNAILRTRSIEQFPADRPSSFGDLGEFCLVRDLQDIASQGTGGEQRTFVDGLVAAGYQSFLSIRATARERVIRLGFFSKQPAAYTLDDVPIARLIADSIAVVVSHEQLAEAQSGRAGPRVHTDQRHARIRNLTKASGGQPYPSRPIGESPEWRGVLRTAAQVALTDTTVFLQGESGTGKEVIARFVHRASPRKHGPFVAINCAALPEQLFESELFGYERGAFTGALQAKAGQIDIASTGVLFLDEVSELIPTAQAKLLRVLQEREFRRLGGTRLIKADVRVIAASNRDLQRAVADGSFREDLFYRLRVFDIYIPPLRERRGDIPLLIDAFLDDFNRSTGCSSAGLTPDAREMVLNYEWPGNVRELHNALERAAILSDGGGITPEHLSLRGPSVATPQRAPTLSDVERRTIEQVLREANGNKSKAARRLDITRTQLYGRLRKYGLESA